MDTLLYRQKRIFGLVVGVIVAVGLSALLTIGRQEDPTITNLFATIVTPYPGADPARVEALVTKKIEDELQKIEEIEEISSTSRTGISVVSVELSSFIDDARIERTWSEIRDALADAAQAFPTGVPEPTFDNDRTGAYTAIGAISAAPGRGVPLALLQRYAELLQGRLRQAPQTKFVHLFGEVEEEVLVTVDPTTITGLGLTIDEVSAAIRQGDAKVRAGQMRNARADTLIELAGDIEDLERVRRIPVTTAPDGHIVRVADVATVAMAERAPPTSLAYADGVRSVLIAARMEDDRQVDTWTAATRAAIAEFARTLPDGIEHRLIFDQSGYTAQRLGDVTTNMAIGVAIVVAVLFLTLGWRAALVVATVLPLTSLLSLAIPKWIGVPVHQMSVTGMIVALGLLVDAAIVMTDEIRKGLAAGHTALDAVGAAVRRLRIPLLASTVTTVLAFAPMALLPGPAGDFVGSIAIAVIVMLTVSFGLAITVTPALAGWLLPRSAGAAPRSTAIGALFEASLRLAVAHPRLAVLAALVLPAIGFGAFPTLTAQFFPGVDRDQLYIQVRTPAGSSVPRSAALADAMEEVVRAQDGIAHVHWVVGESAPSFYYNMQMNQDGAARFAEALVTTRGAKATEAAIPALQAALDDAFPQAQVLVRGLVQGPPVAAPVELRVVGPDIDRLRAYGEALRARMAATPGMLHTRETLAAGDPKLVFALDEDEARLAGLDLAAIARQLEAALEGATGGSLIESTEELPVRVRLGAEARGDVDAIRGLDVVPPQARAVLERYPGLPLAALGRLDLVPAESPITRRNGERVNTIQGYIARDLLPEEVLARLRADLAAAPLALAPGYRVEIGGDADARAETVTNLFTSIGLIVVLTIATIVLTFNSYVLSLIAGAVCVLSMGLSFLALALFGYPFGIQALIGAIGSIGVSINAAIIVLTALRDAPRAAAGDRTAVRQVVAGSARHIVSTTVTTFGGFLPLILAGGGFWPPFAMAIAGGVLLSTVVSFYFTPPMFLLVYAGRGERRAAARLADVAPHPALAAAE